MNRLQNALLLLFCLGLGSYRAIVQTSFFEKWSPVKCYDEMNQPLNDPEWKELCTSSVSQIWITHLIVSLLLGFALVLVISKLKKKSQAPQSTDFK